jgi:hypothetical protein
MHTPFSSTLRKRGWNITCLLLALALLALWLANAVHT